MSNPITPPPKSAAGRPPSEKVAPLMPVQFYNNVIPTIICPICKNLTAPRHDRNGFKTAKGEIYCTCHSCGRRFAWLEPKIRPL